MSFDFRNVAIEVVDIPLLQANSPLSSEEKRLLEIYAEEASVLDEVVFLQPLENSMFKKFGARDKQSVSVVKAARAAGINQIPAIIGKEFTHNFINLFRRKATENKALNANKKTKKDVLDDAVSTFEALKKDSIPAKGKKAVARFGSKDKVYEKVRLARDLPKEVQDLVKAGKISKSAGRVISYFAGSEKYPSKLDLAKATIANKYSVRNLEAIVYSKETILEESESKHLVKFQSELTEQIGHTVKLRPKSRSREQGKIEIDFYSTESLLSILESLEYCKSKLVYSISGGNHSPYSKPGKLRINYNSLNHLSDIRNSLINN